jgi:predicted restriction endonuclease
MLIGRISSEVSLLDAHSFAWMLSCQMQEENKTADVQAYLNLSSTERSAIIKARIGQGQFRDNLIRYWAACAVTGCSEPKLLRASHIKPWSKSDLAERLSLYNGLLLSPTLDACFDAGLVSFDNKGNIIISSRMTVNDLTALGINSEMKLSKLEPEHQKYLEYHRQNIFE